MATYFHDFADGLTGWTGDRLIGTGVTWSTSGGVLQENTSSVTDGLSYDAVDGAADIEVVAKVRGTTNSGGTRHLFVRGNSDVDFYYARIRAAENTVAVGWVSNSGVAQSISSVAAGITIAADITWYWMRFRVIGTSLKLRVWEDGNSEPGTWQIDTTNSTITAGGHAGAMTAAISIDQEWQYFGFGTNGDTAPTSAPVVGGSLPPLRSVMRQQHLLVR